VQRASNDFAESGWCEVTSGVTRVTVDEVLSENLVRFETSQLKKENEQFFDDFENWGDKKEVLMHRNQYKRRLHLPQPWDALEEGQVFLVGEFEVVDNQGEPKNFKFSPGKNNFVRIDNLRKFKDKVKRLYSDLLTGR
jgi:hypothetical protein